MLDEKVLKTNEVEVRMLVTESHSFKEVLKKLELLYSKTNDNRLRRYIKSLDINYQHFTKTKGKSDERWSESNLNIAVKGSKTYKDVLEKLSVLPITSAYSRLKTYLDKYNIEFKPSKVISYKWEEENLEIVVNKSNSKQDCLIKMGLRAAGDNFKQLTKYVELYNLDITHFSREYKVPTKKKELSEVLVKNSSYSRTNLKKRLYDEGLREKSCEMCGQGEEWKGKKMSLILDHINGVHNDNRIENLRIVCPNCNSTLDTHAGKNNKNKKKERLCDCGNKISKLAKKCTSCHTKNKRKVERPSHKQLIKEVKELGYSGTGRKYGVSDNAIRKWLK